MKILTLYLFGSSGTYMYIIFPLIMFHIQKVGENNNLVNKSPITSLLLIIPTGGLRLKHVQAQGRSLSVVSLPNELYPKQEEMRLPQKCKTTVLIADKKETGPSAGSSLPAINNSQLGRVVCLGRLRQNNTDMILAKKL